MAPTGGRDQAAGGVDDNAIGLVDELVFEPFQVRRHAKRPQQWQRLSRAGGSTLDPRFESSNAVLHPTQPLRVTATARGSVQPKSIGIDGARMPVPSSIPTTDAPY